MPEAVIVSTARSPIGRANKGSLVDVRPDDLAAAIVTAALDKLPQLDRQTVEDVMIGCAQPAGEQGYNLGRVVALLAGHGRRARHDRQPLLLVVAADHPHGRARDQVGRGRRVRRRRRRVREPVRQGPLRRQPRHHQRPRSPTPRRARRRARRPARRRGRRPRACPTSTSRWARPRRTWCRPRA